MKIALDIHGVISSFPEFFSFMTLLIWKFTNAEIHILTGLRTEEAINDLQQYGISYDKIFSITDYLIENKLHIGSFDKYNRPIFIDDR